MDLVAGRTVFFASPEFRALIEKVRVSHVAMPVVTTMGSGVWICDVAHVFGDVAMHMEMMADGQTQCVGDETRSRTL